MSALAMEESAEILEEFLVECRDALGEIEAVLTGCFADELETEQINLVFRSFHSMKGTAGFLALDRFVSVTHKAESLLQIIRDNTLTPTDGEVDLLCDAVDFCRDALEVIASDGGDGEMAALADELAPLLVNACSEAEARAGIGGDDVATSSPQETAPERVESADDEAAVASPVAPQAADDSAIDPLSRASRALRAVADSNRRSASRPAVAGDAESGELLPQVFTFGKPKVAQPPGSETSAAEAQKPVSDQAAADATGSAAPAPAQPPTAGTGAAASTPATRAKTASPPSPAASLRQPTVKVQDTLRVDVEKLDSLMNLVGELILAETMVTQNQDLVGYEFESFQKAALQLNRVTRALQDIAMSVRMMPLRSTLRKLHRIVRDVAGKQGKDVELKIVGEDTEVDKNLIEGIADPLVHIIRNSVDHGVEDPEARAAAGKPTRGTVVVEAKQEGSEVWVVVRDDGKGLDRDRILARGLDRGLISLESDPSDSEIFSLIFNPGFSTAAQVTDVSGRGVGMDVVRKNIEALRGSVDIASTQGVGTTITLRIPLTLAIIDGMLVRMGGTVYTIPVLAIEQSMLATEEMQTTLPTGEPVVSVRGRFLPLVTLPDLFSEASEMTACGADAVDESHRKHATADARPTYVVVTAADQKACVRVDEILGQRQTVIKALPSYLGHLKQVSGCSILADGAISLIVDVGGLLGRSQQESPAA